MASVRARPKGVVAVIPPWNFPIAIPCGGVAAALAAGKCVILKPASDAVLAEGRLELLWYLHEPRISRDYHHHGSIGERGEEYRAPAL